MLDKSSLSPSVTADDPPHLPTGGTVLFQGDSITDGGRGRSLDPNHILGHSYAFLVAARCAANFPAMGLEFYNRGVSGDRINRLYDRRQVDILDLKPDLLSVLIGVNDAASAVKHLDEACTPAQFGDQYDRLLQEVTARLPKVQIVLCEPFFLEDSAKEFGAAMRNAVSDRAAVVKEIAQRYGAPLVRFQDVFHAALHRAPAAYWAWDGIHPTYAGHQLMADAWLHTVNSET